MKLGKKLIIYTDGSYMDGKNGWAFKILYNIDKSPWIIGYGSSESINSGQAEIQACIEALNYIPEINGNHINKIETIELRTDFMQTVKFINNFNKPRFEERLRGKNYSCYSHDFLILLNTIKKIPLQVQAKKVNNKYPDLLKVHTLAKYALKNIPIDNLHLYIKSDENKTEKIIDKNNKEISYKEYTDLTQNQKLKWFDNITNNIVNLPLEQIFIEEEIHLQSRNISFNGTLIKIKEKGSIDVPIAVRKNGEKYVLIAGMSRLCAAKLFGFQTIPAVIYEDDSHLEFMLKHVI